MDDNNIPTSYEFLKNNVYNKMKSKLLLFPIKVEFNNISNFLFNIKILKTFFQKGNNNNIFQTSFILKKPSENQTNNNSGDKNKDNYNEFIILGDNKNEKNDKFIVKSIYSNHYLNHSIIILRFIKDKTSNNNDIEKNNSNIVQFLDIVISFYIDINDNSTVLINELYSNLLDSLFLKFLKIVDLFYQKLEIFVREKMNKFYNFESILIDNNMKTIFNYLYACKIFDNENFKIQKIRKQNQDMEITCEIGSFFPVSVCETKLFIRSLSNQLCLVEIVNWINTSDFNTQGKLLNIKSIISVFLKKLRSKINNEYKGSREQKEKKYE